MHRERSSCFVLFSFVLSDTHWKTRQTASNCELGATKSFLGCHLSSIGIGSTFYKIIVTNNN